AAGWFDYDNDGWLDLFVVNYARWSPAYDRFCGDQQRNIRVYCHPKYFEGLPNTLYHNRGNGTFEDVSEKAGILKHVSRGMSVAFADYEQDGYMDAFVTNDKLPNFLFHNRGNGTFQATALSAGAALLEHGKPVSSMAVDFRDFNNDGRMDVVVTALGEPLELWENASPKENHWLLIKLIGTRSNRDGIGTRIRIGSQSNGMTTSVGYASSSHHGVHFGLGKADSVDKIEIFWPSGKVQVLRGVAAN